jgi:hypothetical protein
MSAATAPAPPSAPRPPQQQRLSSDKSDSSASSQLNPRTARIGSESNGSLVSSTAVVAAPPPPPVGAQPSGLQDVAFYTSVANEFPDSSAPVLTSLLHSHRSVVSTEMNAEVQLMEVKSRVETFRSIALEKAASDAALQQVELKQEQFENQKDLMRRDVEHGHAWKRMEELVSQMEKRMEADLSTSDSSTASQFTDAWEELARRRAAMDVQLLESYRALEKMTEEDLRAHLEMEFMAKQSKTIVNEAVSRSVVRADEETERLRLSFQFRNEGVLRLLDADAANCRRDILAEEQRNWSYLHEHYVEEHQRVERYLNVQRSFDLLLYHVAASEKGMRFNEEMDEERNWVAFLEDASQRRVVLDVVESAVSSSVRH